MTTYLSIDNVVYNENDANAVFTLRVLGEPATTDITIDLEKKVPGTGGALYTVAVPAVTIPAGATEIQITLPLTSASAPGFMLYLSTVNKLAQIMSDSAKAAGKSWTDYKFTDPVSKKILPKAAYCEKQAEFVVCSGIYKR